MQIFFLKIRGIIVHVKNTIKILKLNIFPRVIKTQFMQDFLCRIFIKL